MEEYFKLIEQLLNKIDFKFDCIVALKRSGWMIGVYISNKTSKPIFTVSEINSIPDKYKNILIVDDKICKGELPTHSKADGTGFMSQHSY